jgi:hypothetical protein
MTRDLAMAGILNELAGRYSKSLAERASEFLEKN